MSEDTTTQVTGEQGTTTTITGDATGATQTAGTVTFSAEQQAHIDALLGRTRKEARERAKTDQAKAQAKAKADADRVRLEEQQEWKTLAEQHQSRIAELEPLEARVTAYQETITAMLADRIEALGDKAETAIDGLPGDMDALAKLKWLNANEALFAQRAGTPQIDATRRNEGTTPAEVTDAEVIEFAARLGLNPAYVNKAQVLKARLARQAIG